MGHQRIRQSNPRQEAVKYGQTLEGVEAFSPLLRPRQSASFAPGPALRELIERGQLLLCKTPLRFPLGDRGDDRGEVAAADEGLGEPRADGVSALGGLYHDV